MREGLGVGGGEAVGEGLEGGVEGRETRGRGEKSR